MLFRSVAPGAVDNAVVFGALCGAIAWNVITWWFGIPSSSSHALVGGLVGAALAKAGPSVILAPGLVKTSAAIVLSPLLGLLLAMGIMVRASAAVTALLMLGFIAGIASVWYRGYSIDCGCFGGGWDISPQGRALRYTQEIIRDSAFTGMALWLYRWPATRWSLERL